MKVGSPEAIQMLIDNGADKEIRSTMDTKFLTPALLAVVEGQVDCLEKLIDNDVNLLAESSKFYLQFQDEEKNEDYGMFTLAVIHDQPKIIEFLVSLGEDTWRNIEKTENSSHGKQRGTIMGLAVKLNRIKCLETLLFEDFSPGEDAKDLKHALCLAAESGNSECLDLLLEYGIASEDDILPQTEYTDVEQRTLLFAVLRDDEQMLKTLLDNGFGVSLWDGNMSALHAAAVQGNVNCLKYILEHRRSMQSGNGIRATDGCGKSALWYAARRGHPECIEMLIKAGAWPTNFENGLDIVEDTFGHQHYCVPCQRKQTCVCYGIVNKCQIQGTDHTKLECIYHADGHGYENFCTDDCNCDMGKTIELLCSHAISVYGEENDVGQQCVSQILNKAMNACICNDQADTLKWVLTQGADPTQIVMLPPNGKIYPLFGAIFAEADKCFKVLLEYGKTFLPEKCPIDLSIPNITYNGKPTLETVVHLALVMDLWDTGCYIKCLHEVGVDLNQRYPNPSGSGPKRLAIHEAVNQSTDVAKIMISLGVSPVLNPDEDVVLESPYPGHLDEMLDTAKHFIVAGFDKAKILKNFDKNIPWRQDGFDVHKPLTEEDQEKIDKFVSDMTTYNSLQEHCREAISKYLMSVRRDTNLFFLMPQLMVKPHDDIWMNDLLLYGLKL